MKNENAPAFAVSREMCEFQNSIEGYPYGLTKLEYVSTQILMGLCANCKLTQNAPTTVQIAISMATELLRKTSIPS
jgi:hypothetical protein